jgi:DNA-binding NtrC family response regulator
LEAAVLEILVVDDEADIRMGVACELAEAGHHVTEAADGAEALRLIGERAFDIVITDVRLPHLDGLTLLEQVRRRAPETAVILITAYGRVADATKALHGGAYDYVTKPFDLSVFPVQLVARIAAERHVDAERQVARAQLDGEAAGDEMVGCSPEISRVRACIDKLARSDAPVLIRGESGTGKELVARALHRRSRRAAGPFVAVNCAALPETLIEAELFGHERGAFTGASRRRDGRFRAAHRGTLLLDEVGEIPLGVQAKLLRVLQEGAIEPIGSNTAVPVDVRVVSATHRDLKALIAEGRFREDLYYRLHVLDLELPPLRERPGDLPLLVEHFLRRRSDRELPPPRISAEAWSRMLSHPFPGNVRELAHVVERAVVLAADGEIGIEHLPPDLGGRTPPSPRAELRPLAEAASAFERAYLVEALRLTRGHRARAAQILGISRKTLWEKARAHGIANEELGTEIELDPEDARERN